MSTTEAQQFKAWAEQVTHLDYPGGSLWAITTVREKSMMLKAWRAALAAAAPSPADQWLPIETAPVSGRGERPKYFLASNGHHVGVVARWGDEGFGETIADETDHVVSPEPTHWMPLPAAPGAQPAKHYVEIERSGSAPLIVEHPRTSTSGWAQRVDKQPAGLEWGDDTLVDAAPMLNGLTASEQEAIPDASRLPDLPNGAWQKVPCAVCFEIGHPQLGWIFIPHADGKWVSLMKLPNFSEQIVRHWINEPNIRG